MSLLHGGTAEKCSAVWRPRRVWQSKRVSVCGLEFLATSKLVHFQAVNNGDSVAKQSRRDWRVDLEAEAGGVYLGS